MLAAVAGVCLVIQVVSATFIVRDVESPNAATQIARTLAGGGGYAIAPLPAPSDPAAVRQQPRRAYHLPGEPLYLAAAFRVVPTWLEQYLHVPVTVVLILAITVVAWAAAGRRSAWIAGLLASLDPFVVAHGPVWDDLFLASAAEWTLFAAIALRYRSANTAAGRPGRGIGPRDVVLFAGLISIAAIAAMTRMQSQILLGGVGLAIVMLPWARHVRWMGSAIILGIALGVAAWGARNYVVLGTPLVGTTHDGKTLFESTYATARPTILAHGLAGNYNWSSAPASLAGVETLDEVDADRQFARAAWEYIRANPVDVALTGAFKIGVSLIGIDFREAILSPRNVAVATMNALVLPLAVWGFWLWKQRRPREVRLILTLAAISAGVTLLFLAAGPVGLRYRVGLTGFVYLGLAAWARFRLIPASAAPADDGPGPAGVLQ